MSSQQRGKFTEQHIRALQRAAQAVELRLAGYSFSKIAETLGYADQSGAYRAVKRSIEREIQEPSEALLKTEIVRLEKLQQAVWNNALNGHLGAIDRLLKIMERKGKLQGLDKVDLTPPSAPPAPGTVSITGHSLPPSVVSALAELIVLSSPKGIVTSPQPAEDREKPA